MSRIDASGYRSLRLRCARSFLFNLRTLGPAWWLKCALINLFTAIQE